MASVVLQSHNALLKRQDKLHKNGKCKRNQTKKQKNTKDPVTSH